MDIGPSPGDDSLFMELTFARGARNRLICLGYKADRNYLLLRLEVPSVKRVENNLIWTLNREELTTVHCQPSPFHLTNSVPRRLAQELVK